MRESLAAKAAATGDLRVAAKAAFAASRAHNTPERYLEPAQAGFADAQKRVP